MSTQAVENLASALRRRQVVGSNETALETAQLLRTVISNGRWTTAAALLDAIRDVALRLVRAQPAEFAVGNVVRRVLHLVREEYRASVAEGAPPSPGAEAGPRGDSGMFGLLADGAGADYGRTCYPLKQLVIQGVNELIDELEGVSSTLAHQAGDHVAADDVIMTVGRSRTVERFLLSAARKRRFTVVVAEGGPGNGGHKTAAALSAAGVETLLISDAAVFALMPRVHKVVIGCHAVTADGGVIAPVGTLLLAEAARAHGTPVCVVCGLYKLTPVFPGRDGACAAATASPGLVLPYGSAPPADVLSPLFDHVPAAAVTLLVTNTGGHPPSYVYRLVREMYDPEDHVLA